MKIVLAGSPIIAKDAFKEIIKNFEVVGIVTQQDKPKGRGMNLLPTPISKLAKEYNIKTIKPKKIIEAYDVLKSLKYDILVTFAYGQIIPQKILDLGKYKPINIHGSLLPKYRGAAPIHYAILNNDKEIGITIIEMISKMDAGDIYFKASQKIDENTTTADGFNIISKLAKENIVDWLIKIKNGNFNKIPQGDNFSNSPKIKKDFCLLTQKLNIFEATRKIRGLNNFPGAYIYHNEKRLKIFNVSKEKIKNSIPIKFSDGVLYIIDYQYENKKRITL